MGEVVIHKKYAAHQKSNHAAPGPPAVNGILPPTAAGAPPYTPAPFLYIAKSSKAHNGTCTVKTKKRRTRYLKKDSVMDIEHPGNIPSKAVEKAPPNGSDLVTKVACGQARVTSCGQSAVTVGKSQVAVVGASVILNIPTNKTSVHQSQSKLLDGAGLVAAADDKALNPCRVRFTGDPVALASGSVADTCNDFELLGMIAVAWTRHYSSTRNTERGPFGNGGWRHAYQEWIEADASKVVLHRGDGSRVELPAMPPRSEAVDRGRGIVLARGVDGYQATSVHDGTTHELSPALAGGPPVLQAIRDRFGNRVELRYADDGRLDRIVDTAGRELRLSWDQAWRIVRAEVWARGAPQRAMSYAYSDDGDLATVTNALGESDRYAYDARHRLVAKTLRSGVRFQYLYDDEAGGRCVRSSGPGRLQRVDLQYEEGGAKVVVSGNPEPREYTFTPEGELLREATFDGSMALDYVYDADQLLVSMKTAAGDGTTFEYDEAGRLVKSTDADGFEVTIEYIDGLPVRRTEGLDVTTLVWDQRGAPVSITYPSGATVHQEFDRHGRLVRKVGPDGNIVVVNQYDDEHNLIAVTDGAGATTRYEHDAFGFPVSETDALGRRATWQYDTIGRPVSHVMRDGTLVELEYDAADNVVRSGDGRGLVIETGWFGTGSVARRKMPDGQVWEMAYDILERLREIKNPKGETQEYTYDRGGRVVEEKTFDGQTMRYSYSRGGRLARIDFEDETWIEYEYDEAGFVARKVTPHGTTTFERDARSRVVLAVVEEHDGNTTVEVEWNDAGHIVSVTADGRKTSYTWDIADRVTSRTLPNGETTRYHWDPRGWLIGLDHHGEKILLQRDVLGREVRRYAYGSGLDIRFGYDADDRLTDQQVSVVSQAPGQATAVVHRKWDYGPHARVQALHDSRWGTTRYAHDAIGQLTLAARGRHIERFEYDAAGSLVGAGPDPDPSRWAVRMGNVLVRSPDARFEHDARRRRRRKIDAKDGSVTEYLWDCQGQLREVQLPSGERVLFRYDAFGRRTRKTVVSAVGPDTTEPPTVRTVDYVWDFDELALEIDSEHGERVFVHEPATFFPMLQRAGGESFAFVTDHLGVPRELVDGRGRVAWSAALSAWGKPTEMVHDPSRAAPASTPFRLLGQYADDETGLAYTRCRYFDADTARWLSPDPLRMHGRGANFFAFDGSPTERTDRLGLFTRAELKKFLEDYSQARRDAQECVANNQTGFSQRTVAANNRGDTAHNGGARENARSPHGTNRGKDENIHAEEKLMVDGKGKPISGQAIGADKPHCANCTHDIIASGNVPSTSISPNWNPKDSHLKGPMDKNDPDAQANW